MVLLKHGDFEFHHILSGGFNITEDEPEVLSQMTMADGSIKSNYGNMPKTYIKITFSQLNKETYTEYMSHFANTEDTYTYFSPRQQKLLTKKFIVKFPESSMLFGNDSEQTYDEFEIELSQCGEA